MNIAFLASHGGSNMQAIIDAVKLGRINANLVAVISNNSGSMALKRAKKENIPYYHVSNLTHGTPEEMDAGIVSILKTSGADLVVLAGYMKKIGDRTLEAFKGRILNIHPALLPKFGGQGLYGKRVHEAVLKSGDPVTGVTIHLVDEKYDTGPILAQEQVAVLKDDTIDSLAERVLKKEHTLYAETIAKIISREILLPDT
ncbi:phosphoribosylglycinamide formyltransferase [bacterium]|nr:phosphoribosylglycinamide formyltransferase [bacterium]